MKQIKIMMVAIIFGIGAFVLADEAQIVIDPVTKQIYVTTGSDNTPILQEQTSGNVLVGDSLILSGTNDTGDLITIYSTGDVTNDSGYAPIISITTVTGEFVDALAWMYTNGLTRYNDPDSYRQDDSLTREEAAKIIGEAYRKLGYSTETKNESCTFNDAADFNPTLASHISDVCHRGLFQGTRGNYLPTQTLTKGQALAVLVRMLEGKKSDENEQPRWTIYHQKGLAIGLTTDTDVDNFANPISRSQIAIFIFRIKNILDDEERKMFSLNAMHQITASSSGDLGQTIEQQLQTIASSIDISDDPELQEAIHWMYDNGFTIHQTPDTFDPFTILTREQASKIINTFAALYGGAGNILSENSCQFSDLADTSDDLKSHITSVCRQGLLLGVGDKFNPKATMTKAHFIVALLRLLEGKQLDERTDPRWKNYFILARSLEIIGSADAITFDNPITRYEVAVFLYRFKVKYLLLKNLNNSRNANEIISMVAGSIQTGVTGLPEANVYINTPLLSDVNFSVGYIDTFGIRQKVVKTSNEKFFTNNFVWYGDIYSLETDAKIGTITFIVGNGYIIESNIRYTNGSKDFVITAVPDVQSLYAIRTVQKLINETTTGSGNVGSSGNVQ